MTSCNLFEHIDGLREDELIYTYIIFDGEKSIKTL